MRPPRVLSCLREGVEASAEAGLQRPPHGLDEAFGKARHGKASWRPRRGLDHIQWFSSVSKRESIISQSFLWFTRR